MGPELHFGVGEYKILKDDKRFLQNATTLGNLYYVSSSLPQSKA